MSSPAAPRSGGGAPFRSYLLEGWQVLVGRAARDNDELTFRIGRPQDLWLHAGGYAGSHVLVRTREHEPVPRDVLEQAAQLAAFYSKARAAAGKVPVHVCRVADVRKEPGAPAGQVQLRRYETLRVYVNRQEWERAVESGAEVTPGPGGA